MYLDGLRNTEALHSLLYLRQEQSQKQETCLNYIIVMHQG